MMASDFLKKPSRAADEETTTTTTTTNRSIEVEFDVAWQPVCFALD
jgi:hypothetical protein